MANMARYCRTELKIQIAQRYTSGILGRIMARYHCAASVLGQLD
jgi:hypothetical protein